MAPGSMMPMRGIFDADCCARAASGHAAAERPASNFRRPMVTVMRPSRARCVKGTIARHRRAVLQFKDGRMLIAVVRLRGRKRKGSVFRFAPESGQSTAATGVSVLCQNVWPGRAVQDGLPRSTNVRAASMYQDSEVEQFAPGHH